MVSTVDGGNLAPERMQFLGLKLFWVVQDFPPSIAVVLLDGLYLATKNASMVRMKFRDGSYGSLSVPLLDHKALTKRFGGGRRHAYHLLAQTPLVESWAW